ncbi:MAG TPA: hypothetical protein VMG99_01395 [Thermoplasmata archaeon]|nr:hypothetical protein [Thermoplasmata archaeon]
MAKWGWETYLGVGAALLTIGLPMAFAITVYLAQYAHGGAGGTGLALVYVPAAVALIAVGFYCIWAASVGYRGSPRSPPRAAESPHGRT